MPEHLPEKQSEPFEPHKLPLLADFEAWLAAYPLERPDIERVLGSIVDRFGITSDGAYRAAVLSRLEAARAALGFCQDRECPPRQLAELLGIREPATSSRRRKHPNHWTRMAEEDRRRWRAANPDATPPPFYASPPPPPSIAQAYRSLIQSIQARKSDLDRQ